MSEELFSIKIYDLLKDTVHLGHQTRFGHPKMAPYLATQHNKIHIINLEKTVPMFKEALKYARQVSAQRGTILFVCTKRQGRDIIAEEASRAGMPVINSRWLGGTLTNFRTLNKSVKKLKEMQAAVAAGELEGMSKKEGLMFERKMLKLEKAIGGVQDMQGIPDAIFVIDAGYHKIALAEAQKLGVPVIAVVDTNHSPEGIDYVIPGNDDARRAIKLYARKMADAILEGRSQSVKNVVEAVRGEAGDEFVELEEV